MPHALWVVTMLQDTSIISIDEEAQWYAWLHRISRLARVVVEKGEYDPYQFALAQVVGETLPALNAATSPVGASRVAA